MEYVWNRYKLNIFDFELLPLLFFKMSFFKNINYWRIIEPIMLGTIANIVINYIFDPNNPDFIIKEFIVAIVFATMVTEVSRKIDIVLEKQFSWTHSFKKRFIYHLTYLTVFLVVLLDVLGNIYMWIIGEGFHTLKELLIINISVFILALLLTILKWSIHFYQNWRKAENYLNDSTSQLNALKHEIDKSAQHIELLKGNDVYKINTDDVKYAKIEYDTVWVYFETDSKAIFQGTLNGLIELLPSYLFFRVTRNVILHKDVIIAIASSTYGKIDLKLKEDIFGKTTLTVSRPKASSFRKWYYSTSPINL